MPLPVPGYVLMIAQVLYMEFGACTSIKNGTKAVELRMFG